MIRRRHELDRVRDLLRQFPVVAIVGARQVGKSTLARQVAAARVGGVEFFDLEDPRDLARLAEPMLSLEPLRGLVVLDEVQRRPDLFPVLRVLADRDGAPARFMVLGSASPELLRQSSESLAGRIVYHELGGFGLDEVGVASSRALWLRGGFPRSFLAADDAASATWREAFARTFLERDLPQLGISTPAPTMRRLWTMLAHEHGRALNQSRLARSLGTADHTVRRYVEQLEATYVVRRLAPWHENLAKREVKTPKVYVADSGLLHTLLGLETMTELERHPQLGMSWEGFALGATVRALSAQPRECFFWATHAGAELDLLVVARGRRRGFEFKRTAAPRVTRSMRVALEDLRLDGIDVVYPGERTFPLSDRIRAVGISRLAHDLDPLR